jgi:thymidylate kinase
MLIIIEGVDKTGKTTLTEYLLKKLPKAYMIKYGDRPKDGSYLEREKVRLAHWKMLDVYNYSFKDCVLILDRFFPSEIVYSHKRGYDASKDKEYIEMKNLIEKAGDVIFIHCKTDPEQIAKKFLEDGEDYAKVDEIKQLISRYDEYLGSINSIKIPYDYQKTEFKHVVRKIEYYIDYVLAKGGKIKPAYKFEGGD